MKVPNDTIGNRTRDLPATKQAKSQLCPHHIVAFTVPTVKTLALLNSIKGIFTVPNCIYILKTYGKYIVQINLLPEVMYRRYCDDLHKTDSWYTKFCKEIIY